MWAEKPHVMLAKCAEAAALRKAFPQQLGDLYTKEEIVQAEDTPNAGAQIAGAMAPKPAALAAPAPPPIDQALQRITKCETNDQLDEVVTELSPVFKKKAEREVLRVATTKRREEIAARDSSKAEQTASGKKMPLDAEPSEAGTFVYLGGKTRKANDEDKQLLRPRHTSHFATCPDAAQHRRHP